MHVSGLKKFLVFVDVLEDHGYDVVFSKGKAFLKHVSTGKVKKNGVRVKNIYNLEVDACSALSSMEKKNQSRDVGAL